MRRLILVPLLALAAAAAAAAAEPSDEPVATTSEGAVRGEISDGVSVFRGIPYAAAPVGDLRWRPPQPPKSWQGVREARAFGPDCPGAAPPADGMDEDCLYLNVWSIEPDAAAKKPVMVWIYGGGFRGGSAALPVFDGSALARQGVVLVSFGYRVGPLGFLATPGLSAESPHGASGNYGILDAVAALRWVKQNIAAFGGDPDNVTVFGQSSGSETVNILTASPLAKGLFAKAIAESGASFGVRRALPLAQEEAIGRAFMAERGAMSVAQLRALPWQQVLADGPRKYEPNIDGWVLPESARQIYRAGKQNDVPMLIGNTSQEFGRPPEITPEELREEIALDYGPLAGNVEAQLGPLPDSEAATDARWRLTNAEWGDYSPTLWARLQVRTGAAPIYRYLFDYAPPQPEGRARTAHHGAELPYVFGTYRRAGAPAMGPADDRMHELLSSYWVNFARSGDPNGPGLPEWKASGPAADRVMHFTVQGGAMAPARDPGLLGVIDRHFTAMTEEETGEEAEK